MDERRVTRFKQRSVKLRRSILEMIRRAGAGHIGGDLSVVDILNFLYWEVMDITPETFDSRARDHFVMSKGHSVEALYAVLAERGFYPVEALADYGAFASPFIGHPTNEVPGIEMNTGSLGHGLSIAVGMALGQRMDGTGHRSYVVLGDGELAEGSVWEGVMAAAHHRLGNLTAIVDRNGLQISGSTAEVMAQEPLDARWRAFGWAVASCDGHDPAALMAAYRALREEKDKPGVILANTIKGCGVSFMENQAGWHHRVPNAEEYALALSELNAIEEGLA